MAPESIRQLCEYRFVRNAVRRNGAERSVLLSQQRRRAQSRLSGDVRRGGCADPCRLAEQAIAFLEMPTDRREAVFLRLPAAVRY